LGQLAPGAKVKDFLMVELTALSSMNIRAIATFLNFYVSHGSTTKFKKMVRNNTFIL